MSPKPSRRFESQPTSPARRAIRGLLIIGLIMGFVITKAWGMDAPHTATCWDCHNTQVKFGNQFGDSFGNANLCASCHQPGGVAHAKSLVESEQAEPRTSGNSAAHGTSHRWDSTLAGRVVALGDTPKDSLVTSGLYAGRYAKTYTITINTAGEVGSALFSWTASVPDGGQGTNLITGQEVQLENGITYLGYDSLASTRRFKGALDEVRICKRALSAAEIQSLYTAVAAPATCTIAAPVNGSLVTTANPTLLATVVSNGNPINKVEFFSGNTFLGSARTAPYALVWSNLVSGTYSVSARAWFGPANYSASSAVVNFTVAVPIISTLILADGTLTLQWSGGLPPYQAQTTTNLFAPLWENVGSSTNGTSLTIQPGSEAAFYRVLGQ